MKIVGSVFLLILLVFTGKVSHAQTWKKCAKSGNGSLHDIAFVSNTKGFAVGYTKLLMTKDAGKTWNPILTSYYKNDAFQKIQFVDNKHGFIIGYDDLVLKTTDGGDNWSTIRTGTKDDDFTTMFAKDKDTLFVVGPDDIHTFKYGNYMEYTYNGGTTWNRQLIGSTESHWSMHMWNKNKGIMPAGWGGLFQTNNGFKSYKVNWSARPTGFLSVIKDSVVIILSDTGNIYRSSNYGDSFKLIRTGFKTDFYGIHFLNDSLGMACGSKGTILITKNGGLSWSKMTINTKMAIYQVFIVNKYYAWAVAFSNKGDSTDIFKFGSELLGGQKLNIVTGNVVADVIKNCKKDTKETGAEQVLIKALPGPYYTYTLSDGTYELVLPDTGKFEITAILPMKYGGDKNQCDTLRKHQVYFKSFDNIVSDKNFFFKSDSTIKLEINISSSRKRRCRLNDNVITFRNIGTKAVDSANIQLFYDPKVDILKADKTYSKNNGVVSFKIGKLMPGEGGKIHVLDSVLCSDPDFRGMTACMRVLITPKVMVENTSWDSSWVKAYIKCINDSIAIVKLVNDGNKSMGDSASLSIFLDELNADTKRYKLASRDSLKFELKPKGKLVFVETVLEKQHPYLTHLRLFKERCGDSAGFFSKQQVTKHAMQEYPSFEDEICLVIRDSYDPNDISVIPEGTGTRHYIKNENKLRYTIRFQNTGTDTAYDISIIDTLPSEINIASLEMLGSSHVFTSGFLNGQKRNILKIDFKNIYLVDSFTNEKLSHGYVSFDIRLLDSLKKGTVIKNFADIYFDFNTAVRTNTVFNTIHDTTFYSNKPNQINPCISSFLKVPRDTVICDKYEFEAPFIIKGFNKPTWITDDNLTNMVRKNDTTALFKTSHETKFTTFYELKSCENTWYDTSVTYFWKSPNVKVKDSLYCGAVKDSISLNCSSCTYLWNGVSNLNYFKVNNPGTYTVKVSNLCKSISDTFNLTFLPYLKLNLGRDTSLCNSSKVLLKSNLKPGSFLWNDKDTGSSKLVTQPGKYILKFNNRCNTLSDTIQVSYLKTPVINLGKDSMHCRAVNHPITLDSVKNKSTVKWGDGSVLYNKTIINKGTYFVTLKNVCGSATDTIKLDLLKADFKIFDVCEKDSVMLVNQSTNAEVYNWGFGDGYFSNKISPNHLYTINGVSKTYNVSLVSKRKVGCSDSIIKNVTVNANPSPGFSYTINNKLVNFTAIETNATNYQWTFGDGGTSNTSNYQQTYTYNKFPSGKYKACLKVTNLAGCFADSCIEIQINAGTQLFTVADKILIYPSPSNGNFTLEISELKGKIPLEIYNQIGQIIYKTELNQSSNKLVLNVANGVYWIKVINGEKIYNTRIIINQ